MNPYACISMMLMRCGQSDSVLPPTTLFNEGWMLRLVLDWAARYPQALSALRFEDLSRWYSEALLGSRFRLRRRGDTAGEGFTHADGVIGNFKVRDKRGDIELLPNAKQLTVIEAKMASGLSSGTKHASEFNQAARNVACMAHMVANARIDPATMALSFVVLAPASRIDEGSFALVDKKAICEAVTRRAQAFDDAAADWCKQSFEPVAARCSMTVLSWESVLADVSARDVGTGEQLQEFYSQCLRFNPFRPLRQRRTHGHAQ